MCLFNLWCRRMVVYKKERKPTTDISNHLPISYPSIPAAESTKLCGLVFNLWGKKRAGGGRKMGSAAIKSVARRPRHIQLALPYKTSFISIDIPPVWSGKNWPQHILGFILYQIIFHTPFFSCLFNRHSHTFTLVVNSNCKDFLKLQS